MAFKNTQAAKQGMNAPPPLSSYAPAGQPLQLPQQGGGGAVSGGPNIGIPAGYTPTYPQYSGLGQQNIFQSQPIYNPDVIATQPYPVGAEATPGGWSTEQVVALQRQMEAAGVLKPPYHLGWWDPASESAYKIVLGYANQRGTTAESALADISRAASTYGLQAGPSRQLSPNIIELTNPNDIKNLGSSIAVRTIGRRLTDDEASRLAAAYNQMETDYQRQHYQMDVEGQPNTEAGTITKPEDVSQYLESQITEQNPQEAFQHNYLQNYDIFRGLLASSTAAANRVKNAG